MHRRIFNGAFASALFMPAAGSLALPTLAHAAQHPQASAADAAWTEIEASSGGRLGVMVLDTATGATSSHRADERFPMCSTFKWLAAAFVLHRVDAGAEQLARRVRYGKDALVAYSPATEPHAGGDGMTIAELCEAAITLSDNAAANLLLASFGGPAALTRHLRSLGDTVTRLDRNEPTLNESLPGDPRDTTTPGSMARLLQRIVLGTALSDTSREQLTQWLLANKTGAERLKAGLPADWRIGDKTGTGSRGSTNDVGIVWPPGRAPIVVCALLTQTTAPAPRRNEVIAAVGRRVAATMSK
jgi:beta-lactamase class A